MNAGQRVFSPAPDAVLDPASGRPRFGSYVGAVPRIDLGELSALNRIARQKRWVYVAVAAEDAFVALAIVRFGYAATVFGYALDAGTMRMLGTRSHIAPPSACSVGDGMGEGVLASYAFAGNAARVERSPGTTSYAVAADLGSFKLHARFEADQAPPAITAIAPIGSGRDGLVNTTEKRALLSVTGELEVDGRRRPLAGALGGYDYTHGLLARRTAWRWAFGLGRAKTGERVGFNLVQGFVGEPECAAWVDGEVFPLREGRFAFDPENPLSEWRVSTTDGAADLKFLPGGMHAEQKNLGVVASRFVQPVGVYSG
ncbi:MAG TPA: DUF2804 family protein, partial [Polyangiaceae bacterium]